MLLFHIHVLLINTQVKRSLKSNIACVCVLIVVFFVSFTLRSLKGSLMNQNNITWSDWCEMNSRDGTQSRASVVSTRRLRPAAVVEAAAGSVAQRQILRSVSQNSYIIL